MSLRSKSMVKELSSTTGTGSYTLAGAVGGFRSFDAAYGHGVDVYVPYVARLDDVFEIGVGLLSAASTLERVNLLERSGDLEDGFVDWAAGAKQVYSALGGEAGPQGRNKLDADAAPTDVANFAHGYGVGSLWIANISGIAKGWICFDDGLWYSLGTQFGEVSNPDTMMVDTLAPVNQGVLAKGTTTDGTPLVLDAIASPTAYLTMEPDSSLVVDAIVVARDHADNVSRAWRVTGLFSRNGTANPALIGGLTKTDIAADAAASAWDVDASVDTTNKAVQFTVTGAAAKTIAWMVNATLSRAQ